MSSGLKPEEDAPCWPKQTQRDPSHASYPPISARMRKRRAFADKELENVMLQRELRQRELHRNLPYAALVTLPHPPPPPVSPRLHCCALDEDSGASGSPTYVSLCKYKPVYECDFHFYQLLHLTGRAEDKVRERKGAGEAEGEEEVNELQRLGRHASQTVGLMDSSSTSHDTCSISGSSGVIMGGPDVSDASGTFDPAAAASRRSEGPSEPPGARCDPVKSPDGSTARIPAVRPLPFSVEALLRA